MAAAADHARQAGLPELDFSPAQVLLAFEATLDLPGLSSLIGTPLPAWPAFQPKVYPLSLDFDGVRPETTWSGLQTIVPATVARPVAIRQLGLLVYELLGGSPTAQSSTQARPPLAALSERGNMVLRQALSTDSPPRFQRASDMVAALHESAASNNSEGITPSRIPGARVAPVTPSLPTTFPPLAPASLTPLPLSAAPSGTPPTLPPPLQTALPYPPMPSGGSKPLRGPFLTVLLLLVSFIVLGVIGGASYAAWKIFAPSDTATHPIGEIGHRHPSSPNPEIDTPGPTATPKVAVQTPVPSQTPTSALDRMARPNEMLAQAAILEHTGDDAGALAAYTRVAEDYPESDPGLSRLDSFVSRLRGKPGSPETASRRLQQFRAPMEQAARLGSENAMLYLGDNLLAKEPTTAAEWYRQAADKGQPEAMLALGDMYFRGIGVELEPAQAARWYQLASDKGYPKAKVYLAECYELGKAGLPRNYDKSFQLLNEALTIDPNNAAATEKLAGHYERGRGTIPDTFRAFSLMKRAVELGSTAALGELGAYYMRGVGQKADPHMAVALFKQGLDRNNAPCIFFYAQCLDKGLGGLAANPVDAVGFYRAAAERGFPPARDWCNQHHVSFVPDTAPTP